MYEERAKDWWIEEAIIALLIFAIITHILTAIPVFLQEQFGLESTYISRILGIDPRLDDNTPIGTKILNANAANIYDSPGGAIFGTSPKGALGEVIGGPIFQDGELWWQVEYEDGTIGWVKGKDIRIDLERDQKALKEGTPHGTQVQNTGDTLVYSDPGGGTLVAQKETGDKGTIIGGPVTIDGERWWQVKYEDGTVGWVKESDLEIDVQKNRYALNDDTELGTEVVTTGDIEVWSGPRGGVVVGEQKKGAIGKVINGPVTVGTTRWWQVDFDEGVDGWVKEEDLERRSAVREARSFGTSVLKWISLVISLVFLGGIVYLFFQLRDVNKEEYEKTKPLSTIPSDTTVKNSKWSRVLEHIDSDSPGDWRLAILEADIMLDDMVSGMNYHGDTLGERLSAIPKYEFKTLNKAWEAHKIRNIIAHEGGDYILTKREARRIVDLYREVFEEFFFI